MTGSRRTPVGLRARVLAEVTRTPSPTRAEYKRRSALVAVLGAVGTLSLFVAMGGLAPGARPVERIVFTAGFGFLAAGVLTRLASGRGGTMLGRPKSVLLTAVFVTAPLLAIVAIAASAFWPSPGSPDGSYRTHVACGAISLLQGAMPLVVLVVLWRRSDPVHPAISGAVLGMTAGAWTVAMAYLRCPHGDPTHGMVAHIVPTLILTALGTLLGSVLLRPRRL